MMFKIIICGSRTFKNYEWLKESVVGYIKENNLGTNIEIVSGGARGADLLGEKFAQEWGYRIKKFLPDYATYGKAAPIIRNTEMANYADGCVVFWDRESRGTKDMIQKAYDKKLKVLIPAYFNH